jgi:hypothetical protein
MAAAVLTLYRRHRASCPHSAKSRNAPRTKGCDCPIWVQGSLGGETIRESLNLTSWEAASERVRSWKPLARSEWSRAKSRRSKKRSSSSSPTPKPETSSRKALKKIRHVIERRFLGFCTTKGSKLLRQIDVDSVREFRNQLASDYSPNSARKSLEYVRSFFRFCHQSGWIHPNPALVVKPPKGDDDEIETFEPGEVEAMLRVADTFRTKSHYGPGNRKRIRAMVLLLRYSDIRISDAAVLARAKLQGDKLSV